MSIGHRLSQDELSDATIAELYSRLGAHDTPELFEQPFRLDTDHDMPTGGGNSLDRKTVYIDHTLYQEVMDGAFKKTDLTGPQIIGRWCDHEHSEKSILDGDNACDVYPAGHRPALRKEHEGVLTILCPSGPAAIRKVIENYESVIWPGLLRCYHRPITKLPNERDEETIEIARKLGVIDATKHSKYAVRYGLGENNCRDCSGWNTELLSQQHGALAGCRRISGAVRQDRWCQMWREK